MYFWHRKCDVTFIIHYWKEKVNLLANKRRSAVSGLEMSQNSMRYSWSAAEVDAKLKDIMKNIYDSSVAAAKKYGMEGNLVAGANIAGFLKVADAMLAYGVV
jgi:glutamate dehydrogenase (NADP+)